MKRRIGRPGRGFVLYEAGALPEGQPFITVLTRKDGIVLERGHENVTVMLPEGEKRLHPKVMVEVVEWLGA